MAESSGWEVRIEQTLPRPIAAVLARLPRSRIAAEFRTHLDQVYAAARSGAVRLDGQNVFVYRDVPGAPGEFDVDFGVGVVGACAATGNVVCTATPGGRVATTTHVGDYAKLGDAHAAVVAWCRAHGHALAGTRWEVYGHWQEGVTPRTDIHLLLAR